MPLNCPLKLRLYFFITLCLKYTKIFKQYLILMHYKLDVAIFQFSHSHLTYSNFSLNIIIISNSKVRIWRVLIKSCYAGLIKMLLCRVFSLSFHAKFCPNNCSCNRHKKKFFYLSCGGLIFKKLKIFRICHKIGLKAI